MSIVSSADPLLSHLLPWVESIRPEHQKQCPQIYFHTVFRHSQFRTFTFTTSFTILHVTQHNKLVGAGSNEVGFVSTGYRRRVKKTTYSLLCAIVKLTITNRLSSFQGWRGWRFKDAIIIPYCYNVQWIKFEFNNNDFTSIFDYDLNPRHVSPKN